MFTKNIKDTFTTNLLSAVSGVLGEAKKKCSPGCTCAACEAKRDEEDEASENANMSDANEGYVPTNDLPDAHSRKVAGKLGQLLKREREAKEKRETNGVKCEETEELEEKRGLWDNIHAKRERIKHGSGERMRKPGSKGAPTAADFRASQKEEVELDEGITSMSNARVKFHATKNFPHGSYTAKEIKDEHERRRKTVPNYHAVKASLGEEAEQIDELSDALLKSYSRKALDQSKTATGDQKVKRQVGARNAIDRLGNNTLAKEEVEQVDEVAPPGAKYERMVKHIKKAYAKDGKLTDKEKGIAYATAWKAKNEAVDPGLEDELKATRQTKKSVEDAKKKYAKEEVSIDEAFEQLDELSKATLGRYVKKSAERMSTQGVVAGLKIAKDEKSQNNFDTISKRSRGISTAVKKLTKEDQDFIDSLNKELFDEIEIAEARGRPKKAGAKDFTIHPKTKEKLMHDNPEHMKRLEKLQKHGIIAKPKTEANQHIIQQLQRAKTSMRGGETIHFTHGDSTHVAGTHAAKLLDKYAGMKPNEKEAFQKKIGHSHANLKSEL